MPTEVSMKFHLNKQFGFGRELLVLKCSMEKQCCGYMLKRPQGGRALALLVTALELEGRD